MSEKEELEKYIEVVKGEIKRRGELVTKIEDEIIYLNQQIRLQSGMGPTLDVRRLQSAAQLKGEFTRQLSEKRRVHEQYVKDLNMAKARLSEVEEELASLVEE